MAESIPEYDELKLRLDPGPGGKYRVLALGPDGSAASGSFEPPFSEVELDNFVLRVGAHRRTVRGHRSPEMEEAKRFGSALAEALLKGAVGELFGGLRRLNEERGRGLRITLYLTDVPQLMEIPWEFLYRDRAFLSHSIYTPVVRSLDLSSGIVPRKVTPPLRILGMVSSPEGFARLDVEQERQKLEQAVHSLQVQGLVELSWLEVATAAELDRVIGAPAEEHVLHYIGHGAYDSKTEAGVLVLEDRNRQARELTGEDLAALLQDEVSLRLAVLNSCEGARTSHVDPFSGVASSLLHCGIPAVVGMQFEITDDAAITMSERFYTALAQGYPVDAALAQARKAIFAAGHDIEFGTPVLFLRGSDTHLFDIEGVEAPAADEPAAFEDARGAAAGALPPADPAAERNRDLFDRHADEFENKLYDGQKALLRELIEPDEALLGMCRGGFPADPFRHVAMLLTSERLLWARETAFSKATSGSLRWDAVVSVTARSPNGFELTLRGDDDFAVDSLRGSGVQLGDEEIGFSSDELIEWIERRTGLRPARHVDTEGWSVDLLSTGDRVRELRVQLDHEVHVVKYEVGTLTDKVRLDGKVLYSIWTERPAGYDLVLTDGERTYRARLKVKLSGGGARVVALSLDAEGTLLYRE